MKVNYHNSLNNKSHTKRIIVWALILLVVVVSLRPVIGNFVSTFNNKVFSISNWLQYSSGTIPDYFRDRNQLINEIDNLNSRLAGFDGERKTITNLLAENKTLHSLLSSTSSPRILANIIGRPPQLPFDALLLDVGSKDGIEENALVYVYNDKAVGLIARVFPDSSVVALATSPGVKSSVYVIGPNIFATAVGDGGGVLRVNVPQGLIIKEGDPVVVPALGAGIYGTISKVVSVPTEPVQVGYVTIGTPIQSLRSVTVSQKSLSTVSFEDAQSAIQDTIASQLVIEVPDSFASSTASTSRNTSTTTGTSTP